MKYFFIFLTILFCGSLIWWWLSERAYPVTNLPTKPLSQLKIIAVGDSLVEGQGATAGNDFVSLVGRDLGVTIQNHGVGGDTSKQVLARLDDVTSEKPDVVILLVGGNDALQKIPKAETFQTIATIIETLQTNGSAVVLIGVQGGIIGGSYQQEFDALAKKYQTIYIGDILDGIIGDARYMSDYVHPNDTGYKMVSERVTQEMKKYLK